MKRSVLIALTLVLFSCNDNQVDPADNTVHLAGFVAAPSGYSSGTIAVASYWKDRSYTNLTNTDVPSRVNSLYADGSSVWIGGWKWIAGSQSPGVFWRDGEETVIDGATASTTLIASDNSNFVGVWHEGFDGWVINKNGSSQPLLDTAQNYGPTGLAIDGDDIYISGAGEYHDGTKPDSPTLQNAQCWKNGQLIFRESENSNALSIFIYNDDIYMAGHAYNNGLSKSIACYWKNGRRIDLTDDSSNAIAKSIFVADSHVYVSGMMNDQAVYWKDGNVVLLTTEGTYSMANSVFVKGEDVHIGGHEHGHPAYWLNDVKQDIPNQDKLGQIEFVVVGSN